MQHAGLPTLNMGTWDVHDDMNLFLLPDVFVVEPNGKIEILTINRTTGTISVRPKSEHIPIGKVLRICGILGTINLVTGKYLIVATRRVFVGLINSHAIWRLADYEIIPYIHGTEHLNSTQIRENACYLNMIIQVLDMPHYYFSYTYDITHSLQRFNSMTPEVLRRGLFERTDKRFVWNGYLLKDFRKPDLKKYCLPIMMGYVSSNQVNINGHALSWILISRRSIERAGMRLFSRGIDEDGHVSNFVETEEIIEQNGQKIAFVQTRGSIPVYWMQTPCLKYRTLPDQNKFKDHKAACSKHFDNQMALYGKQVAVNLIDHDGPEQLLEQAYANTIAAMKNSAVRYEGFDFHTECKNMNYARLNVLISRLAAEQEEFGVFHIAQCGTVMSSQTGIFRTNCTECLDRTNVVQFLIAYRSLTNTLMKMKVLIQGPNWNDFEVLYRKVWAQNADILSLQYTGTGALKTDFTRTGKRTSVGYLMDCWYYIMRYLKNNFTDNYQQMGIELFLGRNKSSVHEVDACGIPTKYDVAKFWQAIKYPSIASAGIIAFSILLYFKHINFLKYNNLLRGVISRHLSRTYIGIK